jgi:hypothetical protein
MSEKNDILDNHSNTINCVVTMIYKNKNAIYYLIGSCTAEIVITPLHTIMTNYLVQTSNKSIQEISKKIYQKKSFFGFYEGVKYLLISRILGSSIRYGLYNQLKIYTDASNTDLLLNMANSCISGCIGGMIVHPFDVIANYKQRSVVVDYRIQSLFSGFLSTIVRNIILYSFLFSFYDYINHHTNSIMLACTTTSLITTTLLHPIDYIRTNIMTGKIKYNQINFSNLYRGYSINLLKNISHFLITMIVTEKLKKSKW